MPHNRSFVSVLEAILTRVARPTVNAAFDGGFDLTEMDSIAQKTSTDAIRPPDIAAATWGYKGDPATNGPASALVPFGARNGSRRICRRTDQVGHEAES
jgi:hypothetical protein